MKKDQYQMHWPTNIRYSQNVNDVSLTRADDQRPEGNTLIGLQMGTNKFASQKGFSHGTRHGADIRCDQMVPEANSMIGLQVCARNY